MIDPRRRLPHPEANDAVDDYARVYFDRDHDEMAQALAPRLINGDYSREFVESFLAGAAGSRPIEDLSRQTWRKRPSQPASYGRSATGF